MCKRIVEVSDVASRPEPGANWLNLSEIATVEVTSEEDRFPIETAFGGNGGPGWRAARAGEQVIRIFFDEPAAVRRIRLRFHEAHSQRTQEFRLSWRPAAGGSAEILRQQWNFSPEGATTEIEDYAVSLEGVSALELAIRPDISRNDAVATLAEMARRRVPSAATVRLKKSHAPKVQPGPERRPEESGCRPKSRQTRRESGLSG